MPRYLSGLALSMLVLSSLPALAQKEFGFDNRKGSGQPYLSPEETVNRFKVAPEFEVKLFAGEPDCVNPVAFSIDEKGRVWVLECFEYPSRTPKGKQPRDRIVILEDTDGDGKCDKRTVFAEGKDFPVTEERKKAGLGAFDLATGLEVGNGGVYVGAPPYLWFIENKDDKPGKFETILKGFGSEDTHETLNTFQWGPDGWLYGMQGVFTNSKVESLDGPETRMNAAVWRLHPKTKKFEIFAEGTSNPWGMDWRNTDGQFILACCVIPHLYHIVPGGIYKRQAGASFNPYAYGYINEICDHTFHKESGWAHAGLISLDVPHIPEKYRNSVIFGSIHGCSIKQNVLKPNGSSYTASKAEDFLVSGDKNVRPINMKWGPNGDIYLIDWHDRMPCHQARADEWDYERGRVYRIQLKDRKGTKAEDLGKKSDADLARLVLGSDDPYTARTALRLLGGKSKADIKTALAEAGIDPKTAMLRYLRLVTTNGDYELDTVDPEDPPLKDPKATELVVQSIRMANRPGERLPAKLPEFTANLIDPRPRREIASLAVRLADSNNVIEVLHALMKHKDDAKDPLIPLLTWNAYEKVLVKLSADQTAEKELAWLAEQAPDNIFVRDQIVPRVMRRLAATGKPADLALCLKFIAQVKDLNSREKALDGLALALDKQTVDAPELWATLQPELRQEARLVPLVNKLAVSFRDPAATRRAIAMVRDAKASSGNRTQAVRELTTLKPTEGVTLFLALVKDDADLPVRIEAARGLLAFDQPTIAKEIIAGWANYPAPLRAELVGTMAGRKEWARELLQAVESKKVARTDLSDNTITRIQTFNDAGLNKQIEASWGKTRPTPGELSKLIDQVRGELAAKPASFAGGKLVFEAQCAKCHKFEGKGADVGPLLDGAARDIEYILANVIDPNRVIGAPYFQRIVQTVDGRVEQGLLADEDDKSITLKVENGVLKKFAKKDLEGPVKVLEKSMMPEGLTTGMTKQAFRDLVRYVMAHPYLCEVNVEGVAVSAPVTGQIALPANKGKVKIVAEVTASVDVVTELYIQGAPVAEVRLNDKVIPTTVGPTSTGSETVKVPVQLPKGTHTITMVVDAKGDKPSVTARLLDPERKLAYPEPAMK